MPTASWANRVRPMGLALVEVLSGVVLALGHRAATRIPMTATHQPSSDHPHAAPRAAVPDKPVARAWAEGAELCRDHAAADVRAFAGQVLAQPTGTGDARHPAGLTARQVEVLRLVAAGHSNREIAATLVLSVRTVERHIENIYTRLGVHGNAARVAVTAIAAHTGLLVAS